MEKRKTSLSALKQCRFCLTSDEPLKSIYDRSKEPKNSVPLTMKILTAISVEVFPSDKMPVFVCNRCSFFMDLFCQFKNICRGADESILQHIQSGTALEPIVWPPSLVKLFRYGFKSPVEIHGLETVIEGGATVQVTSQEISDSEGDENVYNVKIGDGSDETSACIKLITSKDNADSDKKRNKEISEGFPSMTKLVRHVRSHAGERSYPCKYCDKSFIKSHHYTRHLRTKHQGMQANNSDRFISSDQYRCEQCEDTFATQDDLIYHSAIHATQNLTCPLCQEKFETVDEVTAHIKSHVNSTEFMCDLCELVFISKEKLDLHITVAHEEELQQENDQNESSMEMEAEDDEDYNTINLKEEDDHMVVEINKADNFMITDTQIKSEEKVDNSNSEESEPETTYMELSTVDTLAIIKKDNSIKQAPEKSPLILVPAIPKMSTIQTEKPNDKQTASILRKAEEVKRKVVLQQSSDTSTQEKKVVSKAENSSSGASDKSLRLLEKELQELKRTTRTEPLKLPVKASEPLRSSRRPQLHTSTPKSRSNDEKKSQAILKALPAEKKMPERRAVKENKEPKEPKENKETKSNNGIKDEKETRTNVKEDKIINDTPKSVIKNGTGDKSSSEDGVRRSARSSKIKDYAKLIRDRQEESDDSDDGDEEYLEPEKAEIRGKSRRSNIKAQAIKTVQKTPVASGAKKRGRPRKEQPAEVPAKVRKDENDDGEEKKLAAEDGEENDKSKDSTPNDTKDSDEKMNVDERNDEDGNTAVNAQQKRPSDVLVSPTGQTLKKVPIKALPPGVKPLPLPASARAMGARELCEMQIGKKMVKVQKIVMTKAEVDAMTKKGLLEMKDGTMVLKQGIKIPTADPHAIKSTLVGEDSEKESPSKKGKGAPTRCDLGQDV